MSTSLNFLHMLTQENQLSLAHLQNVRAEESANEIKFACEKCHQKGLTLQRDDF